MDQKELVSKIYSVHEELRRKRRENEDKDWDKIWKDHTKDFSSLQEYAQAMQNLATHVWEPKNARLPEESESANPKLQLKCRLDWVDSKCKEYFKICREDDERVKLKLLDVGSCYNPFKKFGSSYDITAIDLCPAPGVENEVYQCDFLNLQVSANSPFVNVDMKLVSLPPCSFDIVVFSFFLEYLPDKAQRLASCKKAFQLLKTGGLLFILRPDSSSASPRGNSRLVKALKVGNGYLGFKRIYFEKLTHLWCMGFRKLSVEEHEEYLNGGRFQRDLKKAREYFGNDSESGESQTSLEEFFSITQDFKSTTEVRDQIRLNEDRADLEFFKELPNFDFDSGNDGV